MRLITPEQRRALPRPVTVRGNSVAKRIARQKAIESDLATYVHLKCKHITTAEEIEFFRVWQAKPHRYWCNKCHGWKDEDKPARGLPAIELDELPY